MLNRFKKSQPLENKKYTLFFINILQNYNTRTDLFKHSALGIGTFNKLIPYLKKEGILITDVMKYKRGTYTKEEIKGDIMKYEKDVYSLDMVKLINGIFEKDKIKELKDKAVNEIKGYKKPLFVKAKKVPDKIISDDKIDALIRKELKSGHGLTYDIIDNKISILKERCQNIIDDTTLIIKKKKETVPSSSREKNNLKATIWHYEKKLNNALEFKKFIDSPHIFDLYMKKLKSALHEVIYNNPQEKKREELEEKQERQLKRDDENFEQHLLLLEKEVYDGQFDVNTHTDVFLAIFTKFVDSVGKKELANYSFNDLLRIFMYGIGEHTEIEDTENMQPFDDAMDQMTLMYELCKTYYSLADLRVYKDNLGILASKKYMELIYLLEDKMGVI